MCLHIYQIFYSRVLEEAFYYYNFPLEIGLFRVRIILKDAHLLF